MTDWTAATLGEIAIDAATGPFGSSVSAKNFVTDGTPMLRGSNLSDEVGTRLDTSDLVFVPDSLADQFPRAIAQANDLVFTCWGTVGQIGLIGDGAGYERFLVSNKQMRLRPDTSRVGAEFLYYYLSQPWMIDLVRGQAIGSSVPGFNLRQLRATPVRFPALAEQQAIAEVLGALDDKIAANTALATGCIALARWDYQRSLAVPGASRVPISAVADHKAGTYLAKSDYAASGEYLVYGSNTIMGRHDRANARGPLLVLARIGSNCGSVQWAPRDAWVNNNASALVAKLGVDPHLLRFALDSVDMSRHRAGSGQPFIRVESLLSDAISWPPESEQQELSARVKAACDLEFALAEENRTLAETRDALLPQLMSGKLRVRDAERIAVDAGL